MINQIRAEFKKVFTVRSTYIIFGLMLILMIFFGFYVGGWHSQKSDLLDPHQLFKLTQQAINFLAIFPGIIALLLFTHEFRYNLASHSLTLSNSRSKVLAAKIIVVSVIALISTVVVGILAPLLSRWGIGANHLHLVHQSFYFWNLVWRGLFYGWGYAMYALVIAALVRNQIGGIIVLLIVPGTVEGLLSIWLKSNTVYLPFSALHNVLGVALATVSKVSLTSIHSLYVVLGYLLVGWTIAWFLFLKRDAVSKDS